MRRIPKELVRPFALLLRARGLDPLALARQTGVLSEGATRAPPQLPADAIQAFCAEGARLLGDAHLGLHAALDLPRGALGVVEFGARAAPSADDALQFIARSFPLLRAWSPLELEESNSYVQLTFVPPEGEVPNWEIAEFELALMIQLLRASLGPTWAPERVAFRQRKARNLEPLVAFLRTHRVAFGQATTSLQVKLPASNRRAHGDAALFAYLSAQASRELESVRVDVVPSYIRERLARLLGPDPPTVARLANNLHMSARTLQRRLEHGGVTYQALLDGVRAESATRLLDTTELTVSELSSRLGYASARAFLRAFRRWTGTTPAHWRRRSDVLRTASADER